jgi:NitT/TauT family transport system ATP-binding protein
MTGGLSVSIRGVDFSYPAGGPVFQNFSLELGEESPVVILGPSGCGKTTLLRLVAGILKPRSGDIVCGGSAPEHEKMADNGFDLSMAFQEPRLLPWKTVLENVCLPLAERMGKKEALERGARFLELVSLGDKAASFPAELSGGQRQRVNLARAFACPSHALLLDEPFQSLDIPLRLRLMDLTLSLLEESPRLALMVSHDPREAVYLGARVIVLDKGRVFRDEAVNLDRAERAYGSAVAGERERRFLSLLAENALNPPR